MKYGRLLLLGLCLFYSTGFADTLYQANIGGFTSGVGIGGGVGPANTFGSYTSPTVGYGVSGTVPYDTFNYPYSSRCCGSCNKCNGCNTDYYGGSR